MSPKPPTSVRPSVAIEYAGARGLTVPTAIEELLRILSDTTPRDTGGEALRYRYRNRSDGLDVTARVVKRAVIAVDVRTDYKPRKGGRKHRR